MLSATTTDQACCVGKCQKDFSLAFGSSKCLKCSNSYLSLLIAFALAGIVLVVFLLILKLTVAVGTINGLIFYANIVSVNRAQLFPSGETNILTVFIAWVNLDLGIETCFFDGMDATEMENSPLKAIFLMTMQAKPQQPKFQHCDL